MRHILYSLTFDVTVLETRFSTLISQLIKICVCDEVEAALRRKIVVPTLLIWGTGDVYQEKMVAELSSEFVEDLTVKFIESSNHWVQQEDPELVNLAIRQFITV